jgi:hypothetical protein
MATATETKPPGAQLGSSSSIGDAITLRLTSPQADTVAPSR